MACATGNQLDTGPAPHLSSPLSRPHGKAHPECATGNEPDTRLVARIREGDQAAFGQLVERHREFLRQVIQARVHRPEVAEELVQDVFCRAYSKLPILEEDALVSHWLARMAANAAVSWQRDQQAWKRVASRGWLVPCGVAPVGPDQELEVRETRAQVQEALAHLSPGDWRVVALYYLEGCSCGEISRALRLSLDTVKGRLWRVRRRLRRQLAGYMRESTLAD